MSKIFRNIVIGISGGVDSAVAAHLLKERGYNVLGVFMKNWDEYDETGRCSGEQDLIDAEYACKHLNIELRQLNYVKDYWHAVFSNFLNDYENGYTPNPDILCNKHIKFDLFHKYALQTLNYDAIATGHYASTTFGNYLEKYHENDDVQLLIPKDEFKDQTFFLSAVPRAALRHTMFPLGDMLKRDVKELARHIGLQRLANKRESTGICFVGRRDFKQFIKEYISPKPGNFVDIDSGIIVGQHAGIHEWTIGQRCRLASFLQPYFVARKEIANNTIYVAAGHEHPTLHSTHIQIDQINWLCHAAQRTLNAQHKLRCRFRFQHTKPLVDCTLLLLPQQDQPNVQVVLDRPLRALTPGQYAVFYSQTACLGAARILNAFNQQPHTHNVRQQQKNLNS